MANRIGRSSSIHAQRDVRAVDKQMPGRIALTDPLLTNLGRLRAVDEDSAGPSTRSTAFS
jgi:hypothetical protein